MSNIGFDADDLSITLARFAGKRRDIVYDEAKLKRKAPEPVVFSSATHDCGCAVLKGVATILTETPQQKEFRKDRPWLWYSWEKKEDFD